MRTCARIAETSTICGIRRTLVVILTTTMLFTFTTFHTSWTVHTPFFFLATSQSVGAWRTVLTSGVGVTSMDDGDGIASTWRIVSRHQAFLPTLLIRTFTSTFLSARIWVRTLLPILYEIDLSVIFSDHIEFCRDHPCILWTDHDASNATSISTFSSRLSNGIHTVPSKFCPASMGTVDQKKSWNRQKLGTDRITLRTYVYKNGMSTWTLSDTVVEEDPLVLP